MAAGSHWPYKRLVRALCGAQDVYIIARNATETFDTFQYKQPPIGYVDLFQISESGVLRIAGWAADPNDGVDLEAVKVSVDRRVIMSRKPNLPRLDVAKVLGNENYKLSGWECVYSIEKPIIGNEGMIEVVAVSETGLATMMHTSSLSAGFLTTTDSK
jgi:hypothetical protein